VLLGKLGSCRLLVHLLSPPAACAMQPVCRLTRACSSATSACVLVLVNVCAAMQPTWNLMTCVQQWSLQMQRCKVLLGRERSDTCSRQPCLPAHLRYSPECIQRSHQSGLAAAVHMYLRSGSRLKEGVSHSSALSRKKDTNPQRMQLSRLDMSAHIATHSSSLPLVQRKHPKRTQACAEHEQPKDCCNCRGQVLTPQIILLLRTQERADVPRARQASREPTGRTPCQVGSTAWPRLIYLQGFAKYNSAPKLLNSTTPQMITLRQQ